MENKQIIWAKSILVAYKYFGALCNAIDKMIDSTARNSIYLGGVWDEKNSVMNISKRIIGLSSKKIDYINLKVVVEKVLKAIKSKNAKLVILKYIKCLDTQTIASLMKISKRSCYRFINNAIKEFSLAMQQLGYTAEKMEFVYLNDQFLYSVYQSVCETTVTNQGNLDVYYTTGIYQQYIKDLNRGLVKIIV